MQDNLVRVHDEILEVVANLEELMQHPDERSVPGDIEFQSKRLKKTADKLKKLIHGSGTGAPDPE